MFLFRYFRTGLLVFLLLSSFIAVKAQKEVYIPAEWISRGIPYSMDTSLIIY